MITLLFNQFNLLESTQPELITSYITLTIDIISALILLYKAIKAKNVTLEDICKIFERKGKVQQVPEETAKAINELIEKDETTKANEETTENKTE